MSNSECGKYFIATVNLSISCYYTCILVLTLLFVLYITQHIENSLYHFAAMGQNSSKLHCCEIDLTT